MKIDTKRITASMICIHVLHARVNLAKGSLIIWSNDLSFSFDVWKLQSIIYTKVAFDEILRITSQTYLNEQFCCRIQPRVYKVDKSLECYWSQRLSCSLFVSFVRVRMVKQWLSTAEGLPLAEGTSSSEVDKNLLSVDKRQPKEEGRHSLPVDRLSKLADSRCLYLMCRTLDTASCSFDRCPYRFLWNSWRKTC